MGYRSQVTYAMGFETRKDALAFLCYFRLGLEGKELDAFDDIRQKDYGLYMSNQKYDGQGCIISCQESDTKWDDSGVEEQMVAKMLKEARKKGASTAFLRMGEDNSDYEEEYFESCEDADCEVIVDNHPLQHLHDDVYPIRKIHLECEDDKTQLCKIPELANKEAENGTT